MKNITDRLQTHRVVFKYLHRQVQGQPDERVSTIAVAIGVELQQRWLFHTVVVVLPKATPGKLVAHFARFARQWHI